MTTPTKTLYLELLKKALTFTLWKEAEHKERDREDGIVYPAFAHTMVGLKRLNNIQECVEYVLENQIPGDLMEAGVWRGGSCILMRGILEAVGNTDRKVFVADSFEGMPEPDTAKFPQDAGYDLHEDNDVLAVSLEEVQDNFSRYGLLDERVTFIKGWFKDSLPQAPVDQLAVLRLDCDLYESTLQALCHLYPKLSPGGFCIIDDYNMLPACKKAVDDFRKTLSNPGPLKKADWIAVYWQK